MTTKYRIESQEKTVEQLNSMFKKQCKKVDEIGLKNMDDPHLYDEVNVLNTIRNVLMQQEEKLEEMKNDSI